jgi:hypothetical protein
LLTLEQGEKERIAKWNVNSKTSMFITKSMAKAIP